MQIIPAIDFKDGKVVNLKQGRLDEATDLSVTDYQLNEALTLLKGINILAKGKDAPKG